MLVRRDGGRGDVAEMLVRFGRARRPHELGMSPVFVGVIVVAIVGNAAEHSTAVLVAIKNKMDLSVNIAVGSGIQIALFVAPVLVFASMAMGHEQPLDLHFTPMEIVAVIDFDLRAGAGRPGRRNPLAGRRHAAWPCTPFWPWLSITWAKSVADLTEIPRH